MNGKRWKDMTAVEKLDYLRDDIQFHAQHIDAANSRAKANTARLDEITGILSELGKRVASLEP